MKGLFTKEVAASAIPGLEALGESMITVITPLGWAAIFSVMLLIMYAFYRYAQKN